MKPKSTLSTTAPQSQQPLMPKPAGLELKSSGRFNYKEILDLKPEMATIIAEVKTKITSELIKEHSTLIGELGKANGALKKLTPEEENVESIKKSLAYILEFFTHANHVLELDIIDDFFFKIKSFISYHILPVHDNSIESLTEVIDEADRQVKESKKFNKYNELKSLNINAAAARKADELIFQASERDISYATPAQVAPITRFFADVLENFFENSRRDPEIIALQGKMFNIIDKLYVTFFKNEILFVDCLKSKYYWAFSFSHSPETMEKFFSSIDEIILLDSQELVHQGNKLDLLGNLATRCMDCVTKWDDSLTAEQLALFMEKILTIASEIIEIYTRISNELTLKSNAGNYSKIVYDNLAALIFCCGRALPQQELHYHYLLENLIDSLKRIIGMNTQTILTEDQASPALDIITRYMAVAALVKNNRFDDFVDISMQFAPKLMTVKIIGYRTFIAKQHHSKNLFNNSGPPILTAPSPLKEQKYPVAPTSPPPSDLDKLTASTTNLQQLLVEKNKTLLEMKEKLQKTTEKRQTLQKQATTLQSTIQVQSQELEKTNQQISSKKSLFQQTQEKLKTLPQTDQLKTLGEAHAQQLDALEKKHAEKIQQMALDPNQSGKFQQLTMKASTLQQKLKQTTAAVTLTHKTIEEVRRDLVTTQAQRVPVQESFDNAHARICALQQALKARTQELHRSQATAEKLQQIGGAQRVQNISEVQTIQQEIAFLENPPPVYQPLPVLPTPMLGVQYWQPGFSFTPMQRQQKNNNSPLPSIKLTK